MEEKKKKEWVYYINKKVITKDFFCSLKSELRSMQKPLFILTNILIVLSPSMVTFYVFIWNTSNYVRRGFTDSTMLDLTEYLISLTVVWHTICAMQGEDRNKHMKYSLRLRGKLYFITSRPLMNDGLIWQRMMSFKELLTKWGVLL